MSRLKTLRRYMIRALLKIIVRSGTLTSLYYTFFSGAFKQEQQSTLFGMLKYQEDLENVQANSYLLRRNIHRIEKGLIMKPRKPTFALDYIFETVRIFEKCLGDQHRQGHDQSELRWANDVLRTYFENVEAVPAVEKAKNLYFQACGKVEPGSEIHTPFSRKNVETAAVDYDGLLKLAQRRRSVRWYQDCPVPRDLVDKAVSIALLSPSACNRQPFEFRIFDDRALIEKIAGLASGTRGFAHNFPTLVVVVGKLSAYFYEADRHLIYIDGSLAAMSFMYALETLGLSSCPLNWPDIKEKEQKVRQLLNLGTDERVIMLMSLGYSEPEGLIPYSQKKELHLVRRYN